MYKLWPWRTQSHLAAIWEPGNKSQTTDIAHISNHLPQWTWSHFCMAIQIHAWKQQALGGLMALDPQPSYAACPPQLHHEFSDYGPKVTQPIMYTVLEQKSWHCRWFTCISWWLMKYSWKGIGSTFGPKSIQHWITCFLSGCHSARRVGWVIWRLQLWVKKCNSNGSSGTAEMPWMRNMATIVPNTAMSALWSADTFPDAAIGRDVTRVA